MKFKSAASMIMVKFFAFLSGVSFLVLICIADVPLGEEWKLAAMVAFTVVTALISVLIYDYTILARHVFAMNSVISLVTGVIFKKNTKKLRYLYKTFTYCDSISEFYSFMLHRYDVWNMNQKNK